MRKMKEIGGFFFFSFFFFLSFLSLLFFFYHHVFVVKVQETAWSTSYGVNKTINNPTTSFTPSLEKSNPSNPEPILPPRSTYISKKTFFTGRIEPASGRRQSALCLPSFRIS